MLAGVVHKDAAHHLCCYAEEVVAIVPFHLLLVYQPKISFVDQASTRYLETLNLLGVAHRRTAYNHPEGNSYIERFHRRLKEEEVWLNEYQNFGQAELSIARWIEEYSHDRPHRGLHGRTIRLESAFHFSSSYFG